MNYFMKRKNESVNKREAFIANGKHTKNDGTILNEDIFNSIKTFEKRNSHQIERNNHQINDNHKDKEIDTSSNSFLDSSFNEEMGIVPHKSARANSKQNLNKDSRFEENSHLHRSSSNYGMESYNEEIPKEYNQKEHSHKEVTSKNENLTHTIEQCNINKNNESCDKDIHSQVEERHSKDQSMHNSGRNRIFSKGVDKDRQNFPSEQIQNDFKRFVGSQKYNKHNSSFLNNQWKEKYSSKSDERINEIVSKNSNSISNENSNNSASNNQRDNKNINQKEDEHFYQKKKSINLHSGLNTSKSLYMSNGDNKIQLDNLIFGRRNRISHSNVKAEKDTDDSSSETYLENTKDYKNSKEFAYGEETNFNGNSLDQRENLKNYGNTNGGCAVNISTKGSAYSHTGRNLKEPTNENVNSLHLSQRYVAIGESVNIQTSSSVNQENSKNINSEFLKTNISSTKNMDSYNKLKSNVIGTKEKISESDLQTSADVALGQLMKASRKFRYSNRSYTQPMKGHAVVKNSSLLLSRHSVESNEELAESNGGLAESNGGLAESNEELAESNEELAESNEELAESNEELAESNEELAESNSILSKKILSHNKAQNSMQLKSSHIMSRNNLHKSVSYHDKSSKNATIHKNSEVEEAYYDMDLSNNIPMENGRSYINLNNLKNESRSYSITSNRRHTTMSRENFEDYKNSIILSQNRTIILPENLIELKFNLNGSVSAITESTSQMHMENSSNKSQTRQENLMNKSEESISSSRNMNHQMEHRKSFARQSRNPQSEKYHQSGHNSLLESRSDEVTNHLLESHYELHKYNDNMLDTNDSSMNLNKSRNKTSKCTGKSCKNFIKSENSTHESHYSLSNSEMKNIQSERSSITSTSSQMQLRNNMLNSNNNLTNQKEVYKESNSVSMESFRGHMNSKNHHNELKGNLIETNDTLVNSKFTGSVTKLRGSNSGPRSSNVDSRNSQNDNSRNHNNSSSSREVKNYSIKSKDYNGHSNNNMVEHNLNFAKRYQEESQHHFVDEFQKSKKDGNELKYRYDDKRKYHLNRSEYVPKSSIQYEYKKFNTCVNSEEQKADLLQEFQKNIKTKWETKPLQAENVNVRRKSRENLENYNDHLPSYMSQTSINRNMRQDQNQNKNYFLTDSGNSNMSNIHEQEIEAGLRGKMYYNELEHSFEALQKVDNNDDSNMEFDFIQENKKCQYISNDFSKCIIDSQMLINSSHNSMQHSDLNASSHFDLGVSNKSNKISDIEKFAIENNFNSNYIKRLSMNDNFVNTDLQISYIENEIQNKIKNFDNILGKNFETKCNKVLNRIEKLLSSKFFSET
ncbi:hypothetical protein PGO_143360 [Plasmodium gonderi]|uniref:Uncharacterized protein n=1 Tax=Plasmodium gonderi TaxID=77519 RepID=A0A1Y1JM52_PLAGO|nr:hypothetical protein PGO_143360 [Plasmodium gonderi]GAW83539.1 hypothetical protein PGO_143360 [Plasmodium gonderi]